jgi:Flp pilus assembly protein TadB
MANASKTSVNTLVTGALIAGAAVTAVALSKSENRKKAKRAFQTIVKKGKELWNTPEGQAVVGSVAEKTLGRMVDEKDAKKIVEAVMPENQDKSGKESRGQDQGSKNGRK